MTLRHACEKPDSAGDFFLQKYGFGMLFKEASVLDRKLRSQALQCAGRLCGLGRYAAELKILLTEKFEMFGCR